MHLFSMKRSKNSLDGLYWTWLTVTFKTILKILFFTLKFCIFSQSYDFYKRILNLQNKIFLKTHIYIYFFFIIYYMWFQEAQKKGINEINKLILGANNLSGTLGSVKVRSWIEPLNIICPLNMQMYAYISCLACYSN